MPEATRPTSGALSINWIGEHRRSKEIAEIVGAEVHFIHGGRTSLWRRYLRQFLTTRKLLRDTRPETIVVMQPPVLAIAAVLAYVRRNRALLIGDLHSGTFFDPKWSWASRWVLRVLRRHGGAIVPNDDLADIVTRAHVPVFVSHGVMREADHDHSRCEREILASIASEQYILVPFTYARDEPVGALLSAAGKTPEITWILTGNPPAQIRRDAPSNVVFTGYVSSTDFYTLRQHASAVFALTTQDSTMQSAGYEALSAGTPLATSPFRVLRSYFADAALYVPGVDTELANAASQLMKNLPQWRQRIEIRRAEIIDAQADVQESIRDWVIRFHSAR